MKINTTPSYSSRLARLGVEIVIVSLGWAIPAVAATKDSIIKKIDQQRDAIEARQVTNLDLEKELTEHLQLVGSLNSFIDPKKGVEKIALKMTRDKQTVYEDFFYNGPDLIFVADAVQRADQTIENRYYFQAGHMIKWERGDKKIPAEPGSAPFIKREQALVQDSLRYLRLAGLEEEVVDLSGSH